LEKVTLLPPREKVSLITYQIETLEDSNGEQRMRLLIMKDGERRGVMILDSQEEGKETIARLNGGLIKSRRVAKTDVWLGKAATAIKSFCQTKVVAPLLRSVDLERLTWFVLVGVSWAITAAFLITRNLL
jgi:hypothetical protein